MNFASVLSGLVIAVAFVQPAVADWTPPSQCPSAPSLCDPIDSAYVACGAVRRPNKPGCTCNGAGVEIISWLYP
jgi:hypothetical protein